VSAPLVELTARYKGIRRRGRAGDFIYPNEDGTFRVLADCEIINGETTGNPIGVWIGGVTSEELGKAAARVEDSGEPAEPTNDSTSLGAILSHRLIPFCHYRFYGTHKEYRGEPQFSARSFTLAEQHDRGAVVRYLEAAGAGYGLGAASASTLFDKFGAAAVTVVRTDPETAHAALKAAGRCRVSLANMKVIASILERSAKTEDTRIAIDGIIRGIGFPRDLPKELIRRYGAKAADVLKTDPFRLLVDNFYGCGFAKVDNLYQKLGLPLDDLKRQMFCGVNAIHKDRSGSTWFPVQFVEKAIEAKVGDAEVQPGKAVRLGIHGGYLSEVFTSTPGGAPLVHASGEQPGGRIQWIAERRRDSAELLIAEKLAQLALATPHWPRVEECKGISDHQAAALVKATMGAVCSLIGGPGTGKSHTTAAYIKACIAKFGSENIAVAAPTNKAAVRLTNALRANDIDLTAVSEHRLLGVDSVQGSVWTFRHNERKPIRYKVIFLDESSMRAPNMLCSILRACPAGTHIMFVGDTMQLPPIEPGAAFRDMLGSGVLPFGELTEPQRNAGDIVFACDDIRRGVEFRQSAKLDWRREEGDDRPPANFKFVRAENPDAQVERLVEVLQMMGGEGFDPTWDCQVMVALNKQGKVSRLPLNEMLQRELNPNGSGPKGAVYLTGDKVVCEANGMYKLAEKPTSLDANSEAEKTTFIAKGEFGRVTESEPSKVVVEFEGRGEAGTVIVPVFNAKVATREDEENAASVEETEEGGGDESGGDGGTRLSLAYACTVHKLQGAEAAVALPMVDESMAARGICTKEHFFTAISRGKVLTLPIGKIEVARGFCRRSALDGRKTFLHERIVAAVNGRKLEELL
jgi:exodeoxyribonuclease V alpha subunit